MYFIFLNLIILGLKIVNSQDESCWWTGCQKDNWAVRGCDSYNRTQKDIRDCENGNEYYCCPKSNVQNNNNKNNNQKVNSNNLECWWSSCQPTNLTSRGCPPDMQQAGIQSCGGNDGDIFQCCSDKNREVEEENVNILTGGSFTSYVKHSLLKSRNYTLEPDSLPCLSVDTDKQSILKIKNEGIYTCDICPNFPHKRLVDVFLSNDPIDVKNNIGFPECFGNCFDRKDCVVFSHDNVEHTCYMYNNTMGTYVPESKWTTVLMTQPVGLLDNWSYSRHTEITGDPITSSKENNFQKCLENCDKNDNCNYMSYSLQTMDCLIFDSLEKINYIDLSYGFISAFKVSSIPVDRSPGSRFTEMGADLAVSKVMNSKPNSDSCATPKNRTHSAFFTKECYTSDALGCDSATGCKNCYYPEKSDQSYNLVPCPDSEFTILNDIKYTIVSTMKSCLVKPSCIGVGFTESTNEVDELDFNNFALNKYTTKYLLKYPADNSDDHKIMTKYDFLFNYDIDKISDKSNSFKEISGKKLKECIELYQSNNNYIRMSYSKSTCKLSSEEVKFVYKNGDSVTVFKKPGLTTPLINYLRLPGFSISHDKAKETFDKCDSKCETICAEKCNKDYKDWCTHYSIHYDVDKNVCFFFNFLSEKIAANISLQQDEKEQIFTKQSSLSFTLDSLNKLNPFQSSDIYNCFEASLNPDQTQTSLSDFESNGDENNAISLRRKRGIGDWFKKAAKDVGNFFVDTAKDIAEPIIETAKGAAETVKKTVQGDFDGAKDAFMNIPIVKDVKTAVDLGKAVVTGEWDEAKERGVDLLQSHAVDIVTSVAIPVGGKIIGKGLKTVGKQISKQSKRANKAAKKRIDKVNGNNKKVKKDQPKNKKDKDIDDKRNHCKNKNRPKRQARRGKKRRTPGDCGDDDDENHQCTRPRITNVITGSMSRCSRTARNAVCEFECEPGYDEPRRNVKCLKEGNRDPFWSPRPNCDVVHCSNSPIPLIPLHTPQISTFGSIEFGKHLTAYVVLFNKAKKLPIWSIALHQSDQFMSKNYNALQSEEREEDFQPYACPELRGQQGRKVDYSGSGWDRGHLTPANVARWSEKATLSSNLFINIAPQDPFTNRQPWKHLEAHVECFSKSTRSLVVTGICDAKLGETHKGLFVPECFWKMVCYKDENSNEQVVGFIAKNSHVSADKDKIQRSKDVYTSYDQKEITPLFTGGSPWLLSATEINKGRPIQVGAFPTVWFPVNPYACEKALEISKAEKDAWNVALLRLQLTKLGVSTKKRKPKDPNKKPNKKPKKTGKKRPKRQSSTTKLKRGCSNKSDLRNMMSLLGYDLDDDEDDEDDENDSNNDDEDGSGSDDTGAGTELVSVQNCNKRIIGYYTSWLEKKIEGRQLRRLTHVIYAFLEMRADGSVDIGTPDRKNSADANEETRKAKSRLVNLMQMASLHPHLKVMFAVGGWENSQYFSSVAADPSKRITLISSIIKMIQRYGFDGVDIDWEYPVTGGANEGILADKQNYVLLMKEIRNALDNLANEAGRKEKFLLSFAGAAGQWTLDPGFDLPGLFKYVDFANIMSYDFFGAWSSKWGAYTGPPAPLHFGMPPGFSGKTNVDWSVKYYTCKTSLPHKVNMGVPFYGRYWKNVGDPVDGKDGMWRKAQPVNGIFDGGYVPYDKVEEFLGGGGFQKLFHEKSKTPYAWNPGTKTFLGYENEKSLEYKVKYAAEKNIGGIMIWAVEQDDDDLSLLDVVSNAPLCDKTNSKDVNFKCSPIDEKRWWTPEDGDDKAGLCGKSAPLYKGYYPVCDPDDPGYSCCGPAGYCGSGPKFCDCPTCKNYADDPRKILEKPIKPSVPVTWYLLNDPDGKRGRCGRKIPKINNVFPTCNPDDENAHCCSNGGYCGNKDEFCKCNGCIDFKKSPNFRFGPKKWWDQSDGKDKEGACGPKAPKVDGIYEAECEPNTKFSCCSPNGYCGSGAEYCDCKGCKKFT